MSCYVGLVITLAHSPSRRRMFSSLAICMQRGPGIFSGRSPSWWRAPRSRPLYGVGHGHPLLSRVVPTPSTGRSQGFGTGYRQPGSTKVYGTMPDEPPDHDEPPGDYLDQPPPARSRRALLRGMLQPSSKPELPRTL